MTSLSIRFHVLNAFPKYRWIHTSLAASRGSGLPCCWHHQFQKKRILGFQGISDRIELVLYCYNHNTIVSDDLHHYSINLILSNANRPNERGNHAAETPENKQLELAVAKHLSSTPSG